MVVGSRSSGSSAPPSSPRAVCSLEGSETRGTGMTSPSENPKRAALDAATSNLVEPSQVGELVDALNLGDEQLHESPEPLEPQGVEVSDDYGRGAPETAG